MVVAWRFTCLQKVTDVAQNHICSESSAKYVFNKFCFSVFYQHAVLTMTVRTPSRSVRPLRGTKSALECQMVQGTLS